MRYPRVVSVLTVGLILAGAMASAGDMTLTRDGTLYRVADTEDGLLLSWTTAQGTTRATLIPQTTGAIITDPQVQVDESTGTPHVVWQQGETERATVLLASLLDDTWLGPTVIAGDHLSVAINPQFLIHLETTTVPAENPDEAPIEVSTTVLHLAWWSLTEVDDVGVAMYMGIPTDKDGTPNFDSVEAIQIGDLLPYGIGCSGITDASDLAHPKLFIDPESGSVFVFAADFANCLFQIVELVYEVDDWDPIEKRGRHSIIVGRTMMIAINPELPLGNAAAKVGRGMTVVMYWDNDSAVDYTLLDAAGWAEIKTLELGATLTHEQAVQLIQNLTR